MVKKKDRKWSHSLRMHRRYKSETIWNHKDYAVIGDKVNHQPGMNNRDVKMRTITRYL